MGCATGFIKYLLFIFNLIFVLFGLAIIVLASLALSSATKAGKSLDAPLGVLIFIGAAIFLIAFLGCCGAIRENHLFLVMFAIALIVIIIAEVVVCSLTYVYSKDVDEELAKIFTNAAEAFLRGDTTTDDMVAADTIQKSFQCCGYNDVATWGAKLPDSCCSLSTNAGTCNASSGYSQACRDVFEKAIKSFGSAILGVGIALAIVEILGVIFSLVLAHNIKHEVS